MMEEIKDYGIAVGDRVKPTASFDYESYGGPEGPESVGTVVQVISPDESDPYDTGVVLVIWDHQDKEIAEPWDHSFGELRGYEDGWKADRCAVEKVDG